ncbi:hypothetical protein FSP39_019115 [Pinctada imbricata]|uniref:GH26 domain-containing protein n=1 Tax=Pinctada imbricata TaxID=66713 RepID=A0AA88Y366_PINIB|nr:hypothetical protein FSP39_019115 [Pinctada imbricata]
MTSTQNVIFIYLVNFIINVNPNPVDNGATIETKQLLSILRSFSKDTHRFLFGQHKATMTGCEGGHSPYSIHKRNNHTSWTFTEGQVNIHSEDKLCDIKDLTGEYPSVIGFDLGDLSSRSLAIQKYLIKRAANRGLIVTVSWHMRNPLNGGSPWTTDDHSHTNLSHTVRRLLDGGDNHLKFKQVLNQAADFFLSLHDAKGNLIPVLFRPFHEMDGNWFWWGTGNRVQNTPDDYKRLFRLIVHHMRDIRKVHNLLYVYSPSKTNDKENYLQFYPGDSSVDVLGYDYYFKAPFSPAITDFQSRIAHIADLAKSKGKSAAISEIGITSSGLQKHHRFWTDHVLTQILSLKNASISYIMAWMNQCGAHSDVVRVPYRGHEASSEFLKFYHHAATIFGSEMKRISIVPQIVG